jgi:TIR domain
MTKTVFISYRWDDTGAAAGRVYDRLRPLLTDGHLFFDVNTLIGGEDLKHKIISALSKTDIALVFIGDKWLEPTKETGQPRLWQSADLVRTEVREALRRPILVLPVLVNRAEMPKADQLPEDIQAITSKSGLRLRHESFDDDTEGIVATIFGTSRKPRSWDKRHPRRTLFSCVLGAIAGLICLTLIAFIHSWVLERPLSSSISAPATTLLLIVMPLLGAWLGIQWDTGRRKAKS